MEASLHSQQWGGEAETETETGGPLPEADWPNSLADLSSLK